MEANTIAALWGAASAAVFSLVINLLFRYVDHYREKKCLVVGIKAELEIYKKSLLEFNVSQLQALLKKIEEQGGKSVSCPQRFNHLIDLCFIDANFSKIGVFNVETVKMIVFSRGLNQVMNEGISWLNEVFSGRGEKKFKETLQEEINNIITAYKDLSAKCDFLIADLDKVQSSFLSRFI